MEIFIAAKCYSTAKQTWKNKTGINRARGSPSLKVLGLGESTDRTVKTPIGHGAPLGFTEKRQGTGFMFPFQL